MPSGEYQIGDVRERFSCAPGPAGWRYTATDSAGGSVDIVVDERWRQLRVEIVRGGWRVRGGATGHQLTWVRSGGGEAVEAAQRASGFVGASPGLLVATARSLALEPGAAATVGLVELGGDVLAARLVRQRWRLADVTEHQAELRPLRVERFEVADLDTGAGTELHLAEDVILAATDIELLELDGPPSG
jgi:hypothetical protein